jgi:hypothetical protein
MATTKAAWIDVMGAPQVFVDVHYDYPARLVLANAATLRTMADGIRNAGILADDDAAAFADRILAAPMGDDQGHDVTELGGGWAQWLDNIIPECECGHEYHEGPCTGTGADLDPMYQRPPDEACVCQRYRSSELTLPASTAGAYYPARDAFDRAGL